MSKRFTAEVFGTFWLVLGGSVYRFLDRNEDRLA